MEGGQVLFRVGHAKSDDQSDKAWRAEAWVDRGMAYRLRASRYAGYLVCVCHQSLRHLSVLTPQLSVILLYRPKARFARIII